MATVPAPRTWAAGEFPTATQFNTEIRDAVNFLLAPPRAHAYQAVAQSLTSGVSAVITMDSEQVDTDNIHSTAASTSRLTIVTAGRYRVIGQVAFASNATGYRTATLLRTGATIAQQRHAAVSGTTHVEQVTDDILCVAGDYIELQADQNSTAALNTSPGTSATFLHAVWVSST
jgi:hypothetical protein